MAGLQLSDEEQSERLKAWWKENGAAVIAGVVVGIAVIGGVNYWRSYKADQAEAASALYAQMLEDPGESPGAGPGQKLIDEYAGTPYAGKAALVLAARAFQDDRLDDAMRRLEWVRTNAVDPADVRLASLRLARLLVSSGELEQADSLLGGMDSGGFESEYQELRGDLAMARGDAETAQQAYQAALEYLPETSQYADMLNTKLDAAIGASQ